MELGNKIKQLRFKAGLTQEQLAEQLGVSAQAVSKWENAVAIGYLAAARAGRRFRREHRRAV